jgi:hypothetical protein
MIKKFSGFITTEQKKAVKTPGHSATFFNKEGFNLPYLKPPL